MNKLYIGNLSWQTTEEELQEQFATFGTVVESKIIFDRDTNRSKGFAFVTFETQEGADKAMAEMDGRDFGGRTLKVSVAENRPRKPRDDGYAQDSGAGSGYGEQRSPRSNRRY